MDALSLLRAQVAAKVGYLDSFRCRIDACGEGKATYDALMLKNEHRCEAFREILADIDAMMSPPKPPAFRRQALSREAV